MIAYVEEIWMGQSHTSVLLSVSEFDTNLQVGGLLESQIDLHSCDIPDRMLSSDTQSVQADGFVNAHREQPALGSWFKKTISCRSTVVFCPVSSLLETKAAIVARHSG